MAARGHVLVKYAFITAIEACVDVAQHICVTQGWGPPRDNGDALAVLGRHGVIAPELAGRMRLAAGLRNVLFHEYVEVDDDVVLGRLRDPSDLEHVGRMIVEWLG